MWPSGAPVETRRDNPSLAIAITPSLAISNAERLLEKQSLQIYEKDKLLSKTYTFLYDLIIYRSENFSGKHWFDDDGA